MVDQVMTGAEEDGEIEIVEIDALPASGVPEPVALKDDDDDADDPQVAAKAPAESDDDDDDEEDDGQDQRLAERDEEDEPDAAKKKRRKRAQARREARDRTLAELDFLRQKVAKLEQGQQELHVTHRTMSKADVERRIAEVERDIRTAEEVLAAAVEAGNGKDVAEAIRLRDEARDSLVGLKQTKTSYETDTRASGDFDRTELNKWLSANSSWYGTNTVATAIARTIDAQVAQAGYDPGTPDYYRELSRRLRDNFEGTRRLAEDDDTRRKPNGKDRKKPPPLGSSGRETGNGSGKTQVYVTPERKQAMIEAGYWDDPVMRRKMLQKYADFDRAASASR